MCKPDKPLEKKIYLELDKDWGTLDIYPVGSMHRLHLDKIREDDTTSLVGPIAKEDLWDLIEGQEPEYTDTVSNKEKVADSVERTMRVALGTVTALVREVTIRGLVYHVGKHYPEIGLKDSSIQVYVHDALSCLIDDGKVIRRESGVYVPTDEL